MTIILFLVDTSASMNLKTYLGTSFLDTAKAAIETFLKLRSKDPSSRGSDRYMLLTLEDPPKNIKVGWREGQTVFQQQLKDLEAHGLTSLGLGLGEALRFLNLNRLTSGIDNYGLGRYPYYLEQAVIVCITDGNSLTSPAGVQREIHVPRSGSVGSELTDEPFRWDQRIFSLVLRLPGHQPSGDFGPIVSDTSPINDMCKATGGYSYALHSHRMLYACVESMVSKIQTGVVVSLDKYGPDPIPLINNEDNNSNVALENGYVRNNVRKDAEINGKFESKWHSTMCLMLVKALRTSTYPGHWPIPEAFWPDVNSSALPARKAQPKILFSCDPSEPLVFQEFPFDKYELEPSPLTDFILSRKQANVCWQVFIRNSSRNEGLGHPFGYLKASTNLSCVNLFIMPYNYPVLLPLLEELRSNSNDFRTKPTQVWRAKFDKYLKTVPPYYIPPLKKALQRLIQSPIMPENEQPYSYSVISYLCKIKHTAKEELDRMCELVRQQLQAPPPDHLLTVKPRTAVSLTAYPELETVLRGTTGDKVQALKAELNEFHDFKLHVPTCSAETARRPSCMFHNAFDIPRSQLVQQLRKMRLNLAQELSNSAVPLLEGGMPGTKLKLLKAEDMHNLPVNQMGNYQEYLNHMAQPLREVEAAPVRVHAFGNPFKIDKKNMLVDEADLENLIASSASGTKGGKKPGAGEQSEGRVKSRQLPPKRKPGPLPRTYRFRRKRRRLDSDEDGWSDTSSMISGSDALSIASDLQSVSDLDVPEAESRLSIDESNEPSPSEPRRSASPPEPRLSRDEMAERKRDIRAMIRRPTRSSSAPGVCEKLNVASPTDAAELRRVALLEAGRFRKRNEFVAELNAEPPNDSKPNR